jgi:ubiquinone/menaquinone biosynthesis C-methylase UbiE
MTRGKPLFAALYDLRSPWREQRFGDMRRRVVNSASGRVLEIGAGNGANLPFYTTATEVVLTDIDEYMLRRARKHARRHQRRAAYQLCPAEALPFADAAFDSVVVTLVLCSVSDQALVLDEIRRVLRPGGTLHIIEHVEAQGNLMRRIQHTLTPAWKRIAGGCHLTRRTGEQIEQAGFERLKGERHELPLVPLVTGVYRLPG